MPHDHWFLKVLIGPQWSSPLFQISCRKILCCNAKVKATSIKPTEKDKAYYASVLGNVTWVCTTIWLHFKHLQKQEGKCMCWTSTNKDSTETASIFSYIAICIQDATGWQFCIISIYYWKFSGICRVSRHFYFEQLIFLKYLNEWFFDVPYNQRKIKSTIWKVTKSTMSFY